MILVHTLGPIHTPVHLREVILRDPHHRLKEEKDVGDEPEHAVHGREVRGAVGEFVVLDDDEGCKESEDGG